MIPALVLALALSSPVMAQEPISQVKKIIVFPTVTKKPDIVQVSPQPQPVGLSLRFDSIRVDVLSKTILGHVLQRPYVIQDDVAAKTLSIAAEGITQATALDLLARSLDALSLQVTEHAGVYHVGPRSDDLVMYRPKHRPAGYLLTLVRQAFPDAPASAVSPVAPAQPTQPGQPQQSPPVSMIDTATSEDATVIVLRLPGHHARMVRGLLEFADSPVDQVSVRAVAYDVETGKNAGTSIDLAFSLLSGKLGLSISGPVVTGSTAALTFRNATIDAVARILDKDSRFSTMSRPSVRVRSGGVARFSVGQEVPTLGGVTTNNGGSTQAVVYRQSGIIFEARPVVRDGAIDLQLVQTISAFSDTQTSKLNSPTLTKRELQTELRLKSGEVVILAGLDSDETATGSSSLFGLTLGKTDTSKRRQTLLLIEVTRL